MDWLALIWNLDDPSGIPLFARGAVVGATVVLLPTGWQYKCHADRREECLFLAQGRLKPELRTGRPA